MRKCPFDELYNMWFARCHEELDNFADAEFYYRRSIAIQPKFATAHGRYAEFSWHKLKNIKQANVHFEKSLANKENHVTHRHYAQFLEQNFNDYDKAQFHFERCLQLSPKDHGAHHSYAIVLQKMKADSGRIRFHYDTSISLYDCANVQFSYALYLKNVELKQAALDHFRRALQYDPRNAMYHYQCGLFLFESLAMASEALVHVQNACALAPNDKLYKEMYCKLVEEAKRIRAEKLSPRQVGGAYDQRSEIITANSHWGSPPERLGSISGLHDQQSSSSKVSNLDIPRLCETAQMDEVEKQSVLMNEEFKQLDVAIADQGNAVSPPLLQPRHQCELEFDRFIHEKIASGSVGQEYIRVFISKQINDIRVLEFVDESFLKNEIGMNDLHIRMMLKKVDKFKRDMNIFANWLLSLSLYDEYFDCFEMNGMLTFGLFHHYIKNAQSLADMIGKENLVDALYLFDNTPKQNRQNALGEHTHFVM